MPLLKANFADVPDKRPNLPSNIYTFNVLSTKIEKSTKQETLDKDPNATNFTVELEVADGEWKGFRKFRTTSTKMETENKRFLLSCGIPKDVVESQETKNNGFNTDLCVGKTCRAVVKPNSYVDKSGAMQENSQVSEWLIPGDPNYAV